MADGARVVDSAGFSVGRILDVVLDLQTLEPAYLTVACGPLAGVEVVVPLTEARLLDGAVQLPYTAAGVSGAPRVDGAAGRLDRRQEVELRRYYAGLDEGAPVGPHRPADLGGAAAPEPRPAWPRTPVVATNGHRRTDGTAAGSPRVLAGVDVLPVGAGLDVHTADDGPAAY